MSPPNMRATWSGPAISGTTLTTMPTGEAATDTPYCVRGSELHLLGFDQSSPAVMTSDIVLVRG